MLASTYIDYEALEREIAVGREATAQSRWDQANEIWASMRRHYPTIAVAYVLGGYVALQEGRIEEAEDLLKHATREFPQDLYAHIFFSDVARARNDLATAAERLIRIGATRDPAPYRAAFKILAEGMEKNAFSQPVILELLTLILSEIGEGDPNFVPVALAELNVIQETNDKLYRRIHQIIASEFNNIYLRIGSKDTINFVTAGTDIGNPYLDLKQFAAHQLLYSSRARCYELFHRHATKLLAASREVIAELVALGHVKGLEASRQILIAQVASCLDEHIYNAVQDNACNPTPDRPSRQPSILDQGFARRSARLASAVNRGLPDRPLKIAVCISGQLRGFGDAYTTWQHLNLDQHHTTRFVHTWKKLGRKFPVPQHAMRTMSGELLHAYQSAFLQLGHATIVARYPTMFALFEQGGEVDHKRLTEFYKTPFVQIEEDDSSDFASMSNPHKMYYKIKSCQMMADLSGEAFDLFIRIRPDKTILSAQIDYHRILYESRFLGRIFSDTSAFIHCKLGHVIGDQFAIGDGPAMRVYASAYDQTIASAMTPGGDFPAQFSPHVNLAAATLSGGLYVSGHHGIIFGELVDVTPIPAQAIVQALENDIDPENMSHIDRHLLDSARAEAEREKQAASNGS
ncbi:hypothetical protein MKK88_16035 [Methylobacterium sp. E-005]|uniref:tetratricopeptide repeat protein n=1 Tax=Methylobacterium sp. E-005 TaxID=2836549 RepID=UPI001FBA1A01|nr:hypothetical protein [Methylobacterium sp. E-005]MCJ2087479.1 hypothetical protein [Methylobacterium sp. E-005]